MENRRRRCLCARRGQRLLRSLRPARRTRVLAGSSPLLSGLGTAPTLVGGGKSRADSLWSGSSYEIEKWSLFIISQRRRTKLLASVAPNSHALFSLISAAINVSKAVIRLVSPLATIAWCISRLDSRYAVCVDCTARAGDVRVGECGGVGPRLDSQPVVHRALRCLQRSRHFDSRLASDGSLSCSRS